MNEVSAGTPGSFSAQNKQVKKGSAYNDLQQQKKKTIGITKEGASKRHGVQDQEYYHEISVGNKKYTISPEEYHGVKDLYKTQWADQYGQDDEDQLNKRNGVMPRSFASSYGKNDKTLYDLGLPNSKYFEKYLEAYRTYKEENQKQLDSYKAKSKRLNEFYAAVANQWFDDEFKNGTYDPTKSIEGDTNTWDQRRQQQFFDLLDTPEWADVKELYDLNRRKSKVKDPSAYKSVQEYYEAKFDADAKNRAAYAKEDSADAKSLATGKKGADKQIASAIGEDIVESERASQYSVGFNFDDFDKIYGENIYRHLLTQGLVDASTGEAIKGRTAADQIADIDRANTLKLATDSPERYVQTYTGGDYATMMGDLVSAGIPSNSLKAARDEAISRIKDDPNLTDEEKKSQVKAVKDIESAPRRERNSKVASWINKYVLPYAYPVTNLPIKTVEYGTWIAKALAERKPNVDAAKKFLANYEIKSASDYAKVLQDMKDANRPDSEIREAYWLGLRNTTSRDREELAIAYNKINNGAFVTAKKIRDNYYNTKSDLRKAFGKSDDPNTIGRSNGSSMNVDEVTAALSRSLTARTRASEEGIDMDFQQTMDALRRNGVTAPVMREAANRVLSAWSRTGQIPPQKIESVISSIRDFTDANEIAEHKEIFQAAQEDLDALGYSPLEIHQAFSRMGWEDALDEEEWARAYYTEYELPQEMLNSESAEEWSAMSEEDRIAAASGIWDGMTDEERANLTDDFIANLEYNPIINKDYGKQITEQWVGAWMKTATGLITSSMNIAQLVSTAFGNDPKKLAAAIATGQELNGWDAFNQSVATMNEVQSKLSMYGKAVDQSFVSDAISVGADVFAEILRMQTMNFIGTGISNTIFKIAGVNFVSDAVGNMVPELTNTGRGLNMLAKMAAFYPFTSDATANYWAEAMQEEDATVGDAVAYALICGFLEGAVEKLNADHMFKTALGGDKIANSLIESGRNGIRSPGLLRKMKIINIIGSALGEGGEEGLSYFASLIMGNLTFNKDKQNELGILTGFDKNQALKEAGMGALVGLFANAATLSTYTVDDYVSDYLLNHKISGNIMDITYASAVVESMSKEELDSTNVTADDLMPLTEFKDEVGKILQSEANLRDATERANMKVEEETNRVEEVKNSIAALEQQMGSNRTSSKKKNQISAQLYGEDGHGGLYSKYKEAEKALNKAKQGVQELAKVREAMIAETQKSSELIRKHYIALHYLTSNEVKAMSKIGKADIDRAENIPKLSDAEMIVGEAIRQRRIDLVEMDKRIREIGVTSASIERADAALKSAEQTLSGLEKKLNSVKDGTIKSEENTEKKPLKKKSAEEARNSRNAKTTKVEQSVKEVDTDDTDWAEIARGKGYDSEDAMWEAMNDEMMSGLVIGEPRNYTEEDLNREIGEDETSEEIDWAEVARSKGFESEDAMWEAWGNDAKSEPATEETPNEEPVVETAETAEETPVEFSIDDNLFTSMHDVMVGLENPGDSYSNIQENLDAGRVKLSEETMTKVRRVMAKLGRHVVFSSLPSNVGGLWDGDFIYMNMYQPPVDGKLSPEHYIMRVLLHEFTHSLKTSKMTAEYAKLCDFVVGEAVRQANARSGEKGDWTVAKALKAKKDDYFKKSGGAFDSDGNPIEDIEYYRENGLRVPVILTPETAADEITARFLQDRLFMDKRFINSLVRNNASIAGRALNFIQYCISKIGANSPEAGALVMAQRMYAQAFSKSNESPTFGYRNFQLQCINYSTFKESPEAQELMNRYADAVRSRNTKDATDIVREWANVAFKDSAAPRDENGNLIPLFHGTKSSGHVSFKEGTPVFLATDKKIALSYSQKQDTNALDSENAGKPGIYKMYADVRKPLVVDCNGSQWFRIIPADIGGDPKYIDNVRVIANSASDYYAFDYGRGVQEFDSIEDLRKGLIKFFGQENAKVAIQMAIAHDKETGNKSLDWDWQPLTGNGRTVPDFDSSSDFVSIPYRINPETGSRYLIKRGKNDIPVAATTDQVVAWAKKLKNADGSAKYDSVLFKNVIDADEREEGGGLGTNLVVFDPRNIKSADAFTYESDGQIISIGDRYDTSRNNVLYDMDGDDFLFGNLDENESNMLDQLRRIDEAQDESLRADRTRLQENLNALRLVRDTNWSTDITNRFITPNNTPKHSLNIPGIESVVGKKGALTANELDRVYRRLKPEARQRMIYAIAQDSLKSSKARDKDTGKLLVWEQSGNGAWMRSGDANALGAKPGKSFLNMRNPFVVDCNGSGSDSIKTNGSPIYVTVSKSSGDSIVFTTTTSSGEKSKRYFKTVPQCYNWVESHYGTDVADETARDYGVNLFATTYGPVSVDRTIYCLTSTRNGAKMYSTSRNVGLDFLEEFARAGGYDGVICNNVADVGNLAYAVDESSVVSADATTYADDGSEVMPSKRFAQDYRFVDKDSVDEFLDANPEYYNGYVEDNESSLKPMQADGGRSWLYSFDDEMDFDFGSLDNDDWEDDDYEEDDYEEDESAHNLIDLNGLSPEEIDKAYLSYPKGSPQRAAIIRQCADKALADSQFRDENGQLIDMYRGSGTSAGYTVSDPAYADDFLSVFGAADLSAATYVSGKLMPLKMMDLITRGNPGKYLSDEEMAVYERAQDQSDFTPILDLVTRKLAAIYNRNDIEHTVVETVKDSNSKFGISDVPSVVRNAEDLYRVVLNRHHILEEDVADWDVQWFGHKGNLVPDHLVSVYMKNGDRQDFFFYDDLLVNGEYASNFISDNSSVGEEESEFLEVFNDFRMAEYTNALNDFNDVFNDSNVDFDIRDVETVIGSGLRSTEPGYDENYDPFRKEGIYHQYFYGKNILVVDAQGDNWKGIRLSNVPDFVDGPPEDVNTKSVRITFDGIDRKVGRGNWKNSDYRNAVIYESYFVGEEQVKTPVFSVKEEMQKRNMDLSKPLNARGFFNIIKDSGVFGKQASTVAEEVSKNKDLFYLRKADDGTYYLDRYRTGQSKPADLWYDSTDQSLEDSTSTRMLGHYAYDHGYDGYLVYNLEDFGGKEYSRSIMDNINFNQGGKGVIAVVFDPEQTKSADTETYDDNGRLILPSERFNLNRKDMRYSLDDSMESYLGFDTSAQVSEEEANDWINRAGSVGGFAETLANISVDKRWASKGKRYGTIPEGMDPKVRLANAPNRVEDNVAVSKSVRTVMESAHITDPDQVLMLQDMVLNQTVGVYTPETTQQVYDRSAKEVADTYGGDLNRALDGLQSQVRRGRVSEDTMGLAQVIMAEASKVGDFDLFLRAYAEYQLAGTLGGRIVSQAKLLKQVSGVGQAYYMQRFVDQLNNYDYKRMIDSNRMDPIEVDPDLLKRLALASDATTREEIIDDICQNIAEQIPPTLLDALRAWRYLSMLGNPTTHIRNFVGNVMMRGLAMGKDAVASLLDSAFVEEGERTHAILNASDRKRLGDLADRMFDQYYDDIVADGKYSIRQEIERNYRNYFAVKRNGKYKASFLDKLSKINSEGIEGSKVILGLEGSDRVFLRAGFRDAFMQYIKANNIDENNMTEQQMRAAVKVAIDRAKTNTFRNANQLATYLQKISEMSNVSNLIVEGLVPFKKTPMNILARGIDYSPLGIISGLYQVIDNTIGAKGGETELRHSATEVVDKFASGFTGSALFVIGAILSKMGVLRGSGEDDDDYEKLLKENGEQPYSLNVGDISISLANIAPATIPLFMGVAMNEASEKTGSDNALMDLVSTLSSVANPMMEMSLLSSINEALQSYGTNGIAGNLGNVAWSAAKSYFGQYVPTFPSKIYDALDPIQRTTKSNAAASSADLDYFARSIAKKTPLESTLEPMVDLHGREVNHGFTDKFDLWLADTLSGFVSPGTIKIKHYDAADREIARLVRSTGATEFVPDSPQKYLKVNGERVNLTAKQYTQFSKEYGQAIYSAINNLIYTGEYINASDTVRADMLGDAVSNAKKTIRNMWKDRIQFNTDTPYDTKNASAPEYELADTYIGE